MFVRMRSRTDIFNCTWPPKVQPLVYVVGGGKQAKYGITKQGEVWVVEFYLGRHGCYEGLLRPTQKFLLANGALVKQSSAKWITNDY